MKRNKALTAVFVAGCIAVVAIAGIVTSVISVILTVIMIVGFMYYGIGTTSLMYSETMPFEYFMDDDDYFDYDGDDSEPDLPFGEHHHGQDL